MEMIRISEDTFLVKESVMGITLIFSYNIQNLTRAPLKTKKAWEDASKKFSVKELESDPKLLNLKEKIDKYDTEKEILDLFESALDIVGP